MNDTRIPIGMEEGGPMLVAGIRWTFAPAARNSIDPGMLDLEERLRAGDARIVKHGPHRTVYHVRLPGLNVFWKHCRIVGLRGWLRQCLRPPKARAEFDRMTELAERGIATVEALAWGVRPGDFAGESFLITHELVGAVSLQEYLYFARFEFSGCGAASGYGAAHGVSGIAHTRPPLTPCAALENSNRDSTRMNPRIAAALGQYLARLHDAGVTHPDPHPGNILVATENGEPCFHLIDLHSIQLGKPLSWARSAANLVVFNRWFILRSSRPERLRFWKNYAAARRWDAIDWKQRARDLELLTVRSCLRFWAGRASRCLGRNRYFRGVKSKITIGHALAEMDRVVLQRFLDDPDFPFREPDCKYLKNSRTSTVAEIAVPTPSGLRTMIYKRFNVKKWYAPFLNRLRSSSAMRSWKAGHALRERTLPTPRPWLVLHRRSRFGPSEGYLLCEKVENSHEPHEWLLGIGEGATRTKWELIAELGRLLGRFHDLNLFHRDLKSANVLMTAGGEMGSFHFIDLVGVSPRRRLSMKQRAKNLSRLEVSFRTDVRINRTDKLRFLRAYLRWGLRGRADWKTWWVLIAGASSVKIERNRKAGRAIS